MKKLEKINSSEFRNLLTDLMIQYRKQDEKVVEINNQFDDFYKNFQDDQDDYPECNHPSFEDITDLPF